MNTIEIVFRGELVDVRVVRTLEYNNGIVEFLIVDPNGDLAYIYG